MAILALQTKQEPIIIITGVELIAIIEDGLKRESNKFGIFKHYHMWLHLVYVINYEKYALL